MYGIAKGRLRDGSEEVVKAVVYESSMNSIFSKDHKIDYGDTSLVDLKVVGLVKLVIANV